MSNSIISTSNSIRPYRRVQIFSGGGSRFGYYLGSYAALVAHDLTPDMIIGTCGGSLSAYLVQLAADPQDLQQLMCSRELYRAISAIRHVSADEADRRLKLRYMTHALKRWQLSKQPSKGQKHRQADSHAYLLDELQQLAMFRIENERQWLDDLSCFTAENNTDKQSHHSAPDIAIIASRLYQASDHDDSLDHQLKLQELLFAPPSLAAATLLDADLLDAKLLNAKLSSPAHSLAHERIHPTAEVLTQWDFAAAIRASMADMYYLPPTHIDSLGWCLGGVINLTPIELACQLGETVFAERKSGYDPWLAAPAIQRVFGFDPNERLAQAHGFLSSTESYRGNLENSGQLHWLPFADNGQQLAGQHVKKRFNVSQMTIELLHSDYDGFVTQMQAQWRYGYQRTADYIWQHRL